MGRAPWAGWPWRGGEPWSLRGVAGRLLHYHWSTSNQPRLSLAESFMIFLAPALLCHKDPSWAPKPAQGKILPVWSFNALAGSLWHERAPATPGTSGVENPGGRDSSCSRQEDLSTSVAVIPPMQICPGDLLVYSRVLAHKASGYGEPGRGL